MVKETKAIGKATSQFNGGGTCHQQGREQGRAVAAVVVHAKVRAGSIGSCSGCENGSMGQIRAKAIVEMVAGSSTEHQRVTAGSRDHGGWSWQVKKLWFLPARCF